MDIYDFGARTYAPDICRFWQPDPKAHDYHWLSPYAYCGGDPINFIDPTGEKIYYVDMAGRLITSEEVLNKISNRSEYETALEGLDRVVIIDLDGKIIRESDTFEEGTIQLHNNSQSALKGKDITLLEINNEKAAKAVFELLSKDITGKNKIEFGLNIMDDGAFNDVFTGHIEQELKGFNDVFLMRLEQGHTFKDIDHSHQRTTMPSPSDKKSAKWVYQQLAGKQKNMPTMNIFESWGGRYYKYYPLSNRLTKNRRK